MNVSRPPRPQEFRTAARPSLRQEVAEAIKSYILDNRLKPGDPLPSEAELCTALGASRSSIREAVKTSPYSTSWKCGAATGRTWAGSASPRSSRDWRSGGSSNPRTTSGSFPNWSRSAS